MLALTYTHPMTCNALLASDCMHYAISLPVSILTTLNPAGQIERGERENRERERERLREKKVRERESERE